VRGSFPAGFFRAELVFGSMPIVNSMPFLPVKLVDMAHKETGLELTLESTERQRKATRKSG